jgi:hypothetical protein
VTTRLLALLVLLSALLLPTAALADSLSSTATVTVVVPPMPLAAEVQPGCAFAVEDGAHKAYCTVTLIVADPTLHNTGWKIALAATDFTCTCGGSLVPNALTVDAANAVVVINGQEVDPRGGPRLQANSIGRSTTSSPPVFVAKPGYGNGAYSVTLRLRLSVPAHTTPGSYVPEWSVKLIDSGP